MKKEYFSDFLKNSIRLYAHKNYDFNKKYYHCFAYSNDFWSTYWLCVVPNCQNCFQLMPVQLYWNIYLVPLLFYTEFWQKKIRILKLFNTSYILFENRIVAIDTLLGKRSLIIKIKTRVDTNINIAIFRFNHKSFSSKKEEN